MTTKVLRVNQYGSRTVTIPELAKKDDDIVYKPNFVLYGQSFLASEKARKLLEAGFLLIPTLPWTMDIKGFVLRMQKHGIIDMRLCHYTSDFTKDKLPGAVYTAISPEPFSAGENWMDSAPGLSSSVRLPTAVELFSAAVIARLVHGWILAPGMILRTASEGGVSGTHIGIACTERDGVSLFDINDRVKDPHIGAAHICQL